MIRRALSSALLYTLAFNLTFFVQELFLVVPKALTPGLHPTLFHNNHHWEGSNPLAALFQGTGALATLLSAVVCLLLLRRPGWQPGARLLLVWLAFSGVYMALPQVALGAASHQSDVGTAMDYLGFGHGARSVAVFAALLLMLLAAWPLSRAFLGFASQPARLLSAGGRTRSVFEIATLPALIAIPLIVPFRIPRETEEVVLVPVLVSAVGILCVQAAALFRSSIGAGAAAATPAPIAVPLAALAALLLLFQLVLRHGIAFG